MNLKNYLGFVVSDLGIYIYVVFNIVIMEFYFVKLEVIVIYKFSNVYFNYIGKMLFLILYFFYEILYSSFIDSLRIIISRDYFCKVNEVNRKVRSIVVRVFNIIREN